METTKFTDFGRWLAAASLLVLSMVGSVQAQGTPPVSTQSEVPPIEEPYPFEEISPVEGGTPVRTFKMTNTSIGVRAVAERIIVAFAPGLSDTDRAEIHRNARKAGAGAAVPVLLLRNGSYLVDVTGAASVEAAAQAYRSADVRVLAASPDSISEVSLTPNDPFFPDQDELRQLAPIQAPAAWDRTHGRGVRIAILDSGIDESHPDLAGKIDDRANVIWLSSGTDDDTGHGTSIAGLAGAATNNALGVAGIGYDAHLLNVKVSGGFFSSASTIATGIYWAVDHGADVINISSNGSRDCEPWWIERIANAGVAYVRDAIDYAWSRNVIVVAPSGNVDSTDEFWPASCPHVLSVAATTIEDVLDPEGTRGSWVDVAAPGQFLLSTSIPKPDVCVSHLADERYAFCSGSSGSSAVVAGIAALVRASCGPESNQATIDRITGSADPIPGTGTDIRFGRVNAGQAVCIPRPTGLIVANASATSLSFAWNDRSFETFFEFSYRPAGTTALTTVTLPAGTTRYTATDLQVGVLYDFMVRACDPLGCSDYSNVLHERVNFFQLRVIMRDGGGSIVSTPAGIRCSFTSNRCLATFAGGSTVNLLALGGTDPNTRDVYDFDHWEGACSSSGRSAGCDVLMDQPQVAIAVFVRVGRDPGLR
jgi:thermitase